MRLFFFSLQLLVALLLIFYGVKLGKEILLWRQFSHKISARLLSTRVYGEKKFYVEGTFLLSNGKSVDALLQGPFRNRYIAEEENKRIALREYEIWVDGDKALFKKNLPIKTMLSTALLVLLFIYFNRIKKRY